ncbi:hypothetical protein KAI46_11065 [bacterium]|nr:hypothetical protein [bacterium]
MSQPKKRTSAHIHIDEICEKLGAGFSREKVLELSKEGVFHLNDFTDQDVENNKSTLMIQPVSHTKVARLISSPKELSTTAPNLYSYREEINKFIEKHAHDIRKVNESNQFPISYNQSQFTNHPFYKKDFHYAIKAWLDIYSAPDKTVLACGQDRKKHKELISEYIELSLPLLPVTTQKNIKLILNPIPEKNSPRIDFTTLKSEAFINKPTGTKDLLPLSINHDTAIKCQFYPAELHMAIEVWVNIYGYAPTHATTSKQGMSNWLKMFFPGFHNKVYDRIAVLVNIYGNQ